MMRTIWARVAPRGARLALAVALVAGMAPVAAHGQSSTPRMVRVPFAAAQGDGYDAGSVDVQYAFLACYGELHLALRLAPGSARSNGVYRMGGKTYVAEGPPQISVAKVTGRAARAGSEIIGRFTNGAVGPEGGLGCFSGDLTQLGVLTQWLGPKPKPEQIVNFLNSLTLDVEPMAAVRNHGLEARFRSEDRQRQAAVEAQEKAAREAEEARRLAEVKRAEEARRPVSHTPTGAGGGYAEATPTPAPAVPVTPPPPSREQRVDAAIASDRLLAEQRLQAQREQLAQFQSQMAANEAEAQRQAQAIVAAAPELAQLGAGLEDLINGPYYRAKERQFQAAQAALAGKCLLPTGYAAPRDGVIQFGVPITTRLNASDCGRRATGRFKAWLLEVPEDGRITFHLRSGGPLMVGGARYLLDVRDLEGRLYTEIGFDEYGPLQKTFVRSTTLPVGTYVVWVANSYEYDFQPFELRVDFTDGSGRAVVATAPAPNATTPAAVPRKSLTSRLGGLFATVSAPLRPAAASVVAPVEGAEDASVAAALQELCTPGAEKASVETCETMRREIAGTQREDAPQ